MPIDLRPLGTTGQAISALGFGCGNQAGLLVRGEPRDQLRIIARAVELGVTYFDTAAQYGNGLSEQNLGRALNELKPAGILVGTKLQFGRPDVAAGPARIRQLFEASLGRLRREAVDVLFYHGRLTLGEGGERSLNTADMLGPVLDVFRAFREEGRVRFLGFTGLGETAATARVVETGAFDVFHCYLSAVNPSAGFPVPAGFGQQDFDGLLAKAAAAGMGAFAIRIMAAGALAGEVERHPLASREGAPLIAGVDYAADARQAERLRPLAGELGISLPELAVRFALSVPGVSCALIGISDEAQLDESARAAAAGPLPPDALQRIVASLR
jgi:aryl-alcohol dehydrogenase-like predicted oxidoreductase